MVYCFSIQTWQVAKTPLHLLFCPPGIESNNLRLSLLLPNAEGNSPPLFSQRLYGFHMFNPTRTGGAFPQIRGSSPKTLEVKRYIVET